MDTKGRWWHMPRPHRQVRSATSEWPFQLPCLSLVLDEDPGSRCNSSSNSLDPSTLPCVYLGNLAAWDWKVFLSRPICQVSLRLWSSLSLQVSLASQPSPDFQISSVCRISYHLLGSPKISSTSRLTTERDVRKVHKIIKAKTKEISVPWLDRQLTQHWHQQ